MTEAEQKLLDAFPVGYKHTLLTIAYVKHVLGLKMRPAQRLRFLELLNGLADTVITAEMLAAIQPMSETEAQMFDEARSLDDEGNKCASIVVLTRGDVFAHFLELNLSLLDAIKTHAANSEARQLPINQAYAASATVAALPIATAPPRDWQWSPGFSPVRV